MISTNEARRQIERALRGPLSDAEWAYLVNEGYLSELREELTTPAEVADTVRRLRTTFGRAAGNERERAPAFVERTAAPFADRQRALSHIVALEAAREPEVVAFRADVLGDTLLDWEAVEDWIVEQDRRDGPSTPLISGLPTPPGTSVSPTRDGLMVEPPFTVGPVLPRGITVGHVTLAYVVPGDPWTRAIPVTAGGVLDRLRRLSARLADKYGWPAAAATVFVLTGRQPLVASIRHTVRWRFPLTSMTRIVLEIDPATPPAEVDRAYRQVRRSIVGRRPRVMSRKHLALAVFAAEHSAPQSLKQRMAAWNAAYPEWAYTTVTNFGRDLKSAERRLMRPPYRLSEEGDKQSVKS